MLDFKCIECGLVTSELRNFLSDSMCSLACEDKWQAKNDPLYHAGPLKKTECFLRQEAEVRVEHKPPIRAESIRIGERLEKFVTYRVRFRDHKDIWHTIQYEWDKWIVSYLNYAKYVRPPGAPSKEAHISNGNVLYWRSYPEITKKGDFYSVRARLLIINED